MHMRQPIPPPAVLAGRRFKEVPPKNFFLLWFGNLMDPTIIM